MVEQPDLRVAPAVALPADPCELLPWDSEWFGCRIARVHARRLDADLVASILAWSRDHAVACLYFLADSDHAPTVALAERHGFSQVDVRVTLDRDVSPPAMENAVAPPVVVRQAAREDVPALEAIAATVHEQSRFFFDTRFPVDRAAQFYRHWIRVSCEGWADAVLVAGETGRPVGYASCHLPSGSADGRIGLVGVAPDAYGRGVGRGLVGAAVDWFRDHGARRVRVVTQGRNVAAQRLYQRCGFRTEALQIWFHKWFDDRDPDRAEERH